MKDFTISYITKDLSLGLKLETTTVSYLTPGDRLNYIMVIRLCQ